MKTFRKLLLYISIVLAVIISGLAISVFLFKDRIIKQFVNEANKRLNTPVKIGKIDISMLSDFPNLAIVFTDVYIEDSHPGTYPLLTADRIAFNLNPIEVWRGNYSIRGLSVTGSETNLKINAAGKTNFNIIKEGSGGSGGAVRFDLKNVALTKTIVSYLDQQANQHHVFNSNKLSASISVTGDLYQIEADGNVLVEQIGIGSSLFLANKNFMVHAFIDYDDDKKSVLIKPSTLKVGRSQFAVDGNYVYKEKNLIDIKAEGKNTDIQTLLSLLPEEASKKLKQYRSDGDVFFNLSLKGEISDKKSPFISVAFGCTDATLFHPDYQSRISHANLNGSFASPSLTDLSKAQLFLKDMEGELNGKLFRANLSVRTFDDPYIVFDFKGDLDAASVFSFYPIDDLTELEGLLTADISFEGQTSLLKKKATAQKVTTNGSIALAHIKFAYGKQKIRFRDINGSLQFNNNDLALSNVTGYFENSDFQLNGFFKNIITFLIFENQPIGIETDLRSTFLDLDQLFAIGFSDEQSENYQFKISPNLQLNFNCDVKSMRYKRFKPKNIKGDLLVKNQVAVSRNITMNTLGGLLTVNGIVDAKNPKVIDVISSMKLNGQHLDSIFYVFDNFFQDFIQDKHLKGQAYATIELEMALNEKLNLIPPTMISDISVTVKNGELNNFEPMKKLNKYLDDEGLGKLRFADLKNEIHVENKTIYIPQMEIKSNVTTIQLSGTHTFDQYIDYRVVVPLRNKNKIDPDEAFGAVEDDGVGKAKLFLKITGTTDKYIVSYDKDAVKKKIASDLKKEVQELKDAFKLKGIKKKKELELTDEEFDWEIDN
ncbi:MAG: AsmA family protein [Cyclobacteriaceae bacterium]|nr:AsmA family protein [Cyclobacteriaceae bacterium]